MKKGTEGGEREKPLSVFLFFCSPFFFLFLSAFSSFLFIAAIAAPSKKRRTEFKNERGGNERDVEINAFSSPSRRECNCERRRGKKKVSPKSTFEIKKEEAKSTFAAMGLFRGRRGIAILAGFMLFTGTLNPIATKLQVPARLGA